jgi:hypothetical protein
MTALATPRIAPSRHHVRDDASIDEEIADLAEVRRLIGAGNAAGALQALSRYRSSHPHGVLAPEASMLRIEALVGSGDRAAAVAQAKRLLKSPSGAPYAKRVQSLVPEIAMP